MILADLDTVAVRNDNNLVLTRQSILESSNYNRVAIRAQAFVLEKKKGNTLI
jgi:hypothetical protein